MGDVVCPTDKKVPARSAFAPSLTPLGGLRTHPVSADDRGGTDAVRSRSVPLRTHGQDIRR
jgi:hypothetical protein